MTSFKMIKEAIIKETLLNFVDPSKEVYLEVDASNTGFSGWAYQMSKYSKEDIPRLRAQQERIDKMKLEEIDEELDKIIASYVENEEIPEYKYEPSPSKDQLYEANPSLNIETKDRKKILKDHEYTYIVQTVFFYSKKFTDSQKLSWSSLMKELTGIVICTERNCELLSSAKSLIIISDCATAIYLYHQASSNAIMSRYLARLQSYPFSVLVKHKKGKYMQVADSLSRMWTVSSKPSPDKVSHLSGILVRVPFKPGAIVSVQDIITQIEQHENPLVLSSSCETITKSTQATDESTNQTAEVSTTEINNLTISNKQTNTGTREGIPNRKPIPHFDDRKNITIFSIKLEMSNEINNRLEPLQIIERQLIELNPLYTDILKGLKGDSHIIQQGMILTRRGGHYKRLIPPSLVNFVILKFHLYGHYSSRTLCTLISRTDYWPGMRNDIEEFCQGCLSCLYFRPPKGPREPLGEMLATRVNDVMQVDTVSGLPPKEGKNFFTTVIDSYSKLAFTFSLRQDTAEEVGTNLVEKVFSTVGPPAVLQSDGASNMLRSKRLQEICSLFNIQTKVRTPYSSRSLGLVERCHRSILDGIRSIQDTYDIPWTQALPISTMSYNSMPHTSLGGLSPYEVYFAKTNPILTNLSKPHTAPGNFREATDERKRQIKIARKAIKKVEEEYTQRMRANFGGKEKFVIPGQFVLSLNKMPTAPNEKRKLRPKYYGRNKQTIKQGRGGGKKHITIC